MDTVTKILLKRTVATLALISFGQQNLASFSLLIFIKMSNFPENFRVCFWTCSLMLREIFPTHRRKSCAAKSFCRGKKSKRKIHGSKLMSALDKFAPGTLPDPSKRNPNFWEFSLSLHEQKHCKGDLLNFKKKLFMHAYTVFSHVH